MSQNEAKTDTGKRQREIEDKGYVPRVGTDLYLERDVILGYMHLVLRRKRDRRHLWPMIHGFLGGNGLFEAVGDRGRIHRETIAFLFGQAEEGRRFARLATRGKWRRSMARVIRALLECGLFYRDANDDFWLHPKLEGHAWMILPSTEVEA